MEETMEDSKEETININNVSVKMADDLPTILGKALLANAEAIGALIKKSEHYNGNIGVSISNGSVVHMGKVDINRETGDDDER
jgi:hypothetical protein